MRTALFLSAGFLPMAPLLIVARLFSEHVQSAATWAIALGVVLWLAATGTNMWLGVFRAGYSAAEELPIFLLLFVVPVVAAVLVRWRFL